MPSIIPDRSVIKISGIDSTKFLQNLVTNDVSLLQGSIYAMMLSPQGRFLFDMFIVATEGDYLLDIFTGTKDLMIKKLRMYKINMQVEIQEMEGLSVGYSASSSKETKVEIKSLYYLDPRLRGDDNTGHLGYRVILNSSFPVNNPDHDTTYLHDKYKYTIPDGGIDLLYDKAMPQEYGAEQLHAISYTKGCYIGQEVISRTKSQGVVRKKIYKITTDFDLSIIPHGSEISTNGNKVGIFCSGYIHEGIALIREEDLVNSGGDTVYLLDGKRIGLDRACWY